MKQALTFIDLFAGCGGLSLGLIEAGFKGIFAIEKNSDAFTTLIHNLKNTLVHGYEWPTWLPCQNMTTAELLQNYSKELINLSGNIDVIVGGPPCQGFSFAGLRNPNDPRNRLTEEYIKIVSILKPKILLLENVKGFQAAFAKGTGIMKEPYSDYVTKSLETLPLGYKVFKKILPASIFGVPQPRHRFVMIAIRQDFANNSQIAQLENEYFYDKLLECIAKFKIKNQLSETPTPLKDAIGDLETAQKKLKPCVDSKGFMQLEYKQPKHLNPYLQLMRKKCNVDFEPNSLRIPNHKQATVDKFSFILKHATKGTTVSSELREHFKIQKQCLTVLAPDKLATTTTTSPDDCIHYSEPRILTVRENARIQSFPDWFEFKGKYTTGGLRRRDECPRYTQVGNAVPPLMAEILGFFLQDIIQGA